MGICIPAKEAYREELVSEICFEHPYEWSDCENKLLQTFNKLNMTTGTGPGCEGVELDRDKAREVAKLLLLFANNDPEFSCGET